MEGEMNPIPGGRFVPGTCYGRDRDPHPDSTQSLRGDVERRPRWSARFHRLWGIQDDALGYSEGLPALRRERATSVRFAHPEATPGLRNRLGSKGMTFPEDAL